MAHSTLARLIGARRAIVTAVGAILAALVALGVIPAAAQTPILTVIGVLVAYVAGDSYVQGKHVQAAASTTLAAAQKALFSEATDKFIATVGAGAKPAPADTATTPVPSTGA